MSPSVRPRINLLVPLLIAAAVVVLLLDRWGGLPLLGAMVQQGWQWLMLLGGVALLIGVINVLAIHLWRIQTGQRDWGFSLLLVALLVAVFVAGVISPGGPNAPLLNWVFDSVVAPGQMAIFALLVFFMAAAAYRFLRIGRPGGAWMLAGALLVLLVQWPIAATWLPPAWVNAVFWFVDAPVMAALRGVLLGGGVALLVVGLRLLTGRA